MTHFLVVQRKKTTVEKSSNLTRWIQWWYQMFTGCWQIAIVAHAQWLRGQNPKSCEVVRIWIFVLFKNSVWVTSSQSPRHASRLPAINLRCTEQHASPAWPGFCSAADVNQLDRFLNRSKRFGYCRQTTPPISEWFDAADESLFQIVVSVCCDILHLLLPENKTGPCCLN